MMRHLWIIMMATLLVACGNTEKKELPTENESANLEADIQENMELGFNLDEYHVVEGTIKQNEFFSDILQRYKVPYSDIHALVENARDTFDVRKINYNKQYMVLFSEDSVKTAEYFIYQKDPVNYVVFCLQDSLYAYCERKEIEVRIKEAYGTIESSLYQTMQDNDLSPALAMELSNIYAWTVDFYRIQKGDGFKVVYEEQYVDDERIGVGKILAASFLHMGEDFYSYYFEQDGIGDYFDEQGNSLKKAFLKAPLKFSRISSPFQKKRFHPVLKRYKSHLGTDYAAPTGTPIMAVGDGVIIKSEYKKNNGNYVKIRHNGTYETQYLHMSKRAVKVGDRVRQGETIGYVGSTGLATGPHVCFRFWKNGQQIDHRREKFPPSKPIHDDQKENFETTMLQWNPTLGAMPVGAPKNEALNL